MGYDHQGKLRCHVDVHTDFGPVHQSVLVDFASVEAAQEWLANADPKDILIIERRVHTPLPDAPIYDELSKAWKPGVKTESKRTDLWVKTITKISEATR